MMSRIFTSADQLIGNTPLLELAHIAKNDHLHARILAKLEYFNPAGSVKDRVALHMIEEAEGTGRLQPGATIIEPTSGNTGIGLAMAAAAKGYETILTLPETMSEERRKLLKAYGAKLVLTAGDQGMAGAIEKAKELQASIPGAIILGQFENPANPIAHKYHTGVEILEQVEGQIDGFCSGIGTGGTITGIGEVLKAQYPDITIWAVEPQDAAILSGGSIGTHLQMGIGDGIIPAILNQKIYEDIYIVSDEGAIQTSKDLASKEGIMCGISSGTNVAAAIGLAKKLGKGKTVVTILPDTAERYFSTPLFQND